eukprot:TRINITY_DN75255_c0_g1_i2.p1 TRINITY_DN75255_c0_g1~~TRINITY_DN75255_c0_g1_i2.p1  ORF type:complete len:370 (+),score=103.58 TRINITY_DN75255_c0_g1_i2:28-1110(+)
MDPSSREAAERLGDLCNGENRRVVQAVTATALFILGSWMITRPIGDTPLSNRACPKQGTRLLTTDAGVPIAHPWVYVVDGFDEERVDVLPAFTCGEFKAPTGSHNAQEALLVNVAELKALLDSLRADYWVDRDNLASIIQPSDNGEPAGHFHPLDYTLEIGVFSHDIAKIAAAASNHTTLRVFNDPTVPRRNASEKAAAAPSAVNLPQVRLPIDMHVWNSTTGIVLFSRQALEEPNFRGTAIKVVDKVTGAAVVVTAYAMSEDKASMQAALRLGAAAGGAGGAARASQADATATVGMQSLLPLAKRTMYGVDYPCPASPNDYLSELGGGSWLFRTRGSQAKWLFVAIVFLSLAYWVFKRA